MTQDLSFIHRFEPGTSTAAPLLLLHGPGGDETDLLPLGKALAPDRALLSPRGKVLENGMPRYFHRLAEGMFDEQDVIKRASTFQTRAAAWAMKYCRVWWAYGCASATSPAA